MVRVHSSTALAETVSWYCALMLALMLVLSCCESTEDDEYYTVQMVRKGMMKRPCDEIYVVEIDLLILVMSLARFSLVWLRQCKS
ncbi:hypothetical protein C3L33_02530, partial [Rhododendron williamsianum]